MNKAEAVAFHLRRMFDSQGSPPSSEAWAALVDGTGGVLGSLRASLEEVARARMRGLPD